MLCFILTTLFIIQAKVAFILLTSFSLFYLFIRKIFKNKLEKNSRKVDNILKKQIKSLNEGFGSLKDTLLQNNHLANNYVITLIHRLYLNMVQSPVKIIIFPFV